MKKIFVCILIALILAGAAVAALSDVPAVEWTALGVTFASAGALCVATYKKSQKKDWKVVLAIILIAAGGLGLGLLGLAPDVVSKIIAAVIALVLLIVGVIVGINTAIKKEKK